MGPEFSGRIRRRPEHISIDGGQKKRNERSLFLSFDLVGRRE